MAVAVPSDRQTQHSQKRHSPFRQCHMLSHVYTKDEQSCLANKNYPNRLNGDDYCLEALPGQPRVSLMRKRRVAHLSLMDICLADMASESSMSSCSDWTRLCVCPRPLRPSVCVSTPPSSRAWGSSVCGERDAPLSCSAALDEDTLESGSSAHTKEGVRRAPLAQSCLQTHKKISKTAVEKRNILTMLKHSALLLL